MTVSGIDGDKKDGDKQNNIMKGLQEVLRSRVSDSVEGLISGLKNSASKTGSLSKELTNDG